jgi:hypothetical protein
VERDSGPGTRNKKGRADTEAVTVDEAERLLNTLDSQEFYLSPIQPGANHRHTALPTALSSAVPGFPAGARETKAGERGV